MYFQNWRPKLEFALSFTLLVLLVGCGSPADVSPVANGPTESNPAGIEEPIVEEPAPNSPAPILLPEPTNDLTPLPPAEETVTENPAPDTPVANETNPAAAPTENEKTPAFQVTPVKKPVEGEVIGKAGDDWPTILGPTGDNKSREVGFNFDWRKNPPPIVWKRKLATSYGIGSISQGKMYQFDRQGDIARLVCLDAKTGEQKWEFPYPTDYVDAYGYNNGPRCSPVVDGDRVYIYGAEGILHCLKTSDGSVVWKLNTTEKYNVIQNFFGVGSTPVIEGDLLIVMVGGSPEEDRGKGSAQLDTVTGNGSGIVAFDKMTGEMRYSITDEMASYSSLKLVTINERRWCFAFARGGLVGFEPKTGAVDFEYPWRSKILESVNASVPVVVGDEVFISETYGPGSSLLKVSPKKFEVVWKDAERSRELKMQTHWNTPIHHKGFIYGCSGRHSYDAELRCIEWKTGEVKWSIPELSRTSLLYLDNHFICLGEYGQLFAFKANPEKFDPITQMALTAEAPPAEEGPLGEDPDSPPAPIKLLDYPCWAAPIMSHGLLYVRGKDYLVCLDLTP